MNIYIVLCEGLNKHRLAVRHLWLAVFSKEPKMFSSIDRLLVTDILSNCLEFTKNDSVIKLNIWSAGEIKYSLTQEIIEDFGQQSAVCNLLYKFIKQECDIALPWGILTGVRPLKKYRSLHDKSAMHWYYKVAYEKIALLEQIMGADQTIINKYTVKNPFNNPRAACLYINIPFCPTRCKFCSFVAKAGYDEQGLQLYINALLQELQAVLDWSAQNAINLAAIYIGGGTPAVLSNIQIEQLLSCIKGHNCEEVTFEAGRAELITGELLEVLHRYKVNKICINPQTANQKTLLNMGRQHSIADVYRAHDLTKSYGFAVNMDIIAGLPDENLTDFRNSLQLIDDLQPQAFTVHSLALKSGSELSVNNKQPNNINVTKQMIDLTLNWANKNQYQAYYLYRQKNSAGNLENIGFAKKGQLSIYNILVMEECLPIIGVGAGAASKYVNYDTMQLEQDINVHNTLIYQEKIAEIVLKKQKNLANILTT